MCSMGCGKGSPLFWRLSQRSCALFMAPAGRVTGHQGRGYISHTQTHTQRHTQTSTQTHTCIYIDTHTYINADTQTHTDTHSSAQRHTFTRTYTYRDTDRYTQTHRETHTHTPGHTQRHTDTPSGRRPSRPGAPDPGCLDSISEGMLSAACSAGSGRV